MAYGKSRDNKLLDSGQIVSMYLLPEYFDKGYGQEIYKKNKFKYTKDEYIFDIQGKQLVDVRFILSFD